ncbi:MAG: tape measure protein, partial [Pseudomonadota bacterium]|nr:tape measure protein [Pseudomonadota bacterium]
TLDLKIDRPKLQAEIASAKALIRSELGAGATETVKVKVQADLATIRADLAAMRPQIQAAVRAIGGVSVPVHLRTDQGQLRAQVAAVQAQIRSLLGNQGIAGAVRLDVDLPHLRTQLRSAVLLVRHTIAQMSRLAGRINLNVNITSSLGNLITSLDQLKIEVVRLRQAMSSGGGGGGGGGGAGGGIGGLGGLGNLVSTLAGGLGAGLLARQLVDVQTEFDRLNAGLITATGSAEEAAKAFAVLQEFARNTPYSLAQAVEGFTKLRNMGLTPSERALKSYGNTASAMGKDLMQFIEAVADAATLEFERLKEFGIRASQQGDSVSFTFQGVTTTVKKSAAEIENYLMQIGEVNFDGAMNERMKTLDGAIANFKQSWRDMLLAVSQSGLGDMLERIFKQGSNALDRFTQKIKSGEIPTALGGLARAFSLFGDDVGGDFRAIESAFSGLGEHLKSVWLSTITELNAIGNLWTTVRSLIQKGSVAVAGAVDIVSDPFNKRSSSQQKQQTYDDALAAIDAEAAARLNAVKDSFDQAALLALYDDLTREEGQGGDGSDRLERYKVAGDSGDSGGVDKKGSGGIMPNAGLLQRKRELEQALNMIEVDFSALQNKTQADIETFYQRKMELVKRLHDNEKALLQYQMSQTKDPVQRADIVEQGKDVESKKGQLLLQIDAQKIAEVTAHRDRMRQYQLEFDERAKNVYDLQRTEEQRVRAQYDLERRKIEENSKLTEEQRNNEIALLKQLEASAIAEATQQMLDDEASRLEKVIVDRIEEYRAIEQQIRTKITQNPLQAQQLSIELEQVRQSFFNGEQGIQRFYWMLETLAQQGVPAAIEALKQLRGDVAKVAVAVPTAWQEAIANMRDTAANAGVDSLSGFFVDIAEGAKTA